MVATKYLYRHGVCTYCVLAEFKGDRMKGRGKIEHPEHNHTKQIAALNRIIGQLESVKKMMTDRKYCADIIHQIKTAHGGLVSVEVKVSATHVVTTESMVAVENCLPMNTDRN